MKNKKRILIILFLMIGWSIVAFVSVYSYQKGKEEVASIMKECLDKAIDTDYQQRLNQVLVAYSPLGKNVKSIEICWENKVETLSFQNKTREYLAVRMAHQYILDKLNPIIPDSLTMYYHEEIEKKALKPSSLGIVCRRKDSLSFSKGDSTTYKTSIATPFVFLDNKHSVEVKAWNTLNMSTIMAHTPLTWGILMLLLSLILLGCTIFMIIRNTHTDNRKKSILQKKEQTLVINGIECHIGKTDFCLLCLLVEHQNKLVSIKTIGNTLWPKESNPSNKIYHHISTLKSTLKVFPDYRIETVSGSGYRLKGPEITVEG